MESASWSHLPDAWLVGGASPAALTAHLAPRQGGQAQSQAVPSLAGKLGANQAIPSFLGSTALLMLQIHTGTVDTGRSQRLGGWGSLRPDGRRISSHRYKRKTVLPLAERWQDVFTATAHAA